jgi:SAM-dependent methyltransferase
VAPEAPLAPANIVIPLLFALTLFLSAALLFVVQPMAGKELLPLVGGTPAAWNTCLVFFQAVLLLGYLYAHRLLSATSSRRQVAWHLAVILLGLAAALAFRPAPDQVREDQDYPMLGLIAFLAVLVGAPFFVLSTTAPLLQRWFAATGHRSAADPYYLYAASNAGSLLGLLGYPFLVEPLLPLPVQQHHWLLGYGLFFVLTLVCGLVVLRRDRGAWGVGREASGLVEDVALVPFSHAPRPTPHAPRSLTLLRWIGLAALPSSLLMGVTTHLTTDIAPVPLLWVVPLALYLCSFIVVFAWWPDPVRLVTGRVVPMLLVFLTFALATTATEPIAVVAGLHLVAFFGVALLCHGELAHDRPAREHLTVFYLALSAGGVLGGLFNALLAPLLFSRLGLVEYPLAVVAAALVRPRREGPVYTSRVGAPDFALVMGFAGFVAALAWLATAFVPAITAFLDGSPEPDPKVSSMVENALVFGLPAIVSFALARNAVRFAACLWLLLLVGSIYPGVYGQTLLVSRNFFGTLRVTKSTDGRYTLLVHGTTLHGQQEIDSPGPAKPLMYYHTKGPIGRLLARLPPQRKRRVAVVGLGAGAMAAYAEPGQVWTFYEIDPAVVRIARDSGYFTFLKECRGDLRIVVGDARRRLAEVADNSIDLLALDAFSSDAIPVHLLTQEAFEVYGRKLAPDGVVAFHLSNRYLDLPPMVARLGASHDPPFETWVNKDDVVNPGERAEGKFPAWWAVLARRPGDLGLVVKDITWQRHRLTPGPVWRDDFSNLLAVWKRSEP